MLQRPPLTPRQKLVLDEIRRSIAETGMSPTMRDLGRKLNVTKVTIYEFMNALVEKGYLRKTTKHYARAYAIVDDSGPQIVAWANKHFDELSRLMPDAAASLRQILADAGFTRPQHHHADVPAAS